MLQPIDGHKEVCCCSLVSLRNVQGSASKSVTTRKCCEVSLAPTQTQHGNEMLAKLETQSLAIQFADFLQAGSRILTSLLFSLT